jgi:DNA uptake protein ComE-like DNA-binding protein
MTDSLYFLLEPYIIIGKEYKFQPKEFESETIEATRVTIEVTPFSLDTVGTDYLRAVGFTRRQAELVIKYRDMIGGYRSIEEFEECYAVDSAMAARLRPYLIFPPRDTLNNHLTHYHEARIEFPIELNSADSVTLCKVTGIGAKSASHILFYRELLGGYHSVSQILELKVVTEENFQRILPQIYCDSAKIKKININFARPKELEVHPYISNRMLRQIINNRELKGGWSNLEEMIEDDIFSAEEAARIAPYLDFSIPQE